MIVGLMEIQEFFISQIRNVIRISAGFTSIGGVRKQRIHYFSLQNFIRRGKSSFHLIINNTIIHKRSFRFFQMVAPALLAENFLSFINIGIKHSIQIYMHQILKILVITAGHRIACLIRIGHSIQESIQRSFHQFHKGILKGKFPGTAEDTVLQNVGNACAVFGWCTECYIKYFIFIIVLYEHDSCACFSVTKEPAFRMNVCQIFFFNHFISFKILFIHLFLRFFYNPPSPGKCSSYTSFAALVIRSSSSSRFRLTGRRTAVS